MTVTIQVNLYSDAEPVDETVLNRPIEELKQAIEDLANGIIEQAARINSGSINDTVIGDTRPEAITGTSLTADELTLSGNTTTAVLNTAATLTAGAANASAIDFADTIAPTGTWDNNRGMTIRTTFSPGSGETLSTGVNLWLAAFTGGAGTVTNIRNINIVNTAVSGIQYGIFVNNMNAGDYALWSGGNGSARIGGDMQHVGANAGWRGRTPIPIPVVLGSRGGNVALGNTLTALANQGLIDDQTTA